MKLKAREDLKEPSIAFLLTLDDPTFRSFFSGSPVKRIGRDRFIRNVLIAAGNSGEMSLIEPCRIRLSDQAAVVRAMAVWALSRLLPAEEFMTMAKGREADIDALVEQEWQDAETSLCR